MEKLKNFQTSSNDILSKDKDSMQNAFRNDLPFCSGNQGILPKEHVNAPVKDNSCNIDDKEYFNKKKSIGCNLNGISKSNTVIIRDKLHYAIKERNKLQSEIREFAKKITPIEFESYHEFFLINTFKKGVSTSGRVDIDGLRRRNSSVYYKKIKKRNYAEPPSSTGSSSNTTPNSLSDEDEDEDDDQYDEDFSNGNENNSSITYEDKLYNDINREFGIPRKRRTRAQHAAQVGFKASESQENISRKKSLSEDSNNTSNELENTRRRSSRLSQKTNENKEPTSISYIQTDESSTKIRDLYESLVPKIKDPYRRSDWILPSKFRYTPEKQMRTKPVFEKVKINELVSSNRIQAVLSKFEGGVAGVRKRG